MAETDVTLSVPAELHKISEMVLDGVKAFKAGKSWAEIGMSALPTVLSEFGNMDEIKEELKSDKAIQLAGIVLGSLAGIFLAKQVTTMLAKRAAAKPAIAPAAAAAH